MRSTTIKRQENLFLESSMPVSLPRSQSLLFPRWLFFNVKREQRDALPDLSLNCFNFFPVRWDWFRWKKREEEGFHLAPLSRRTHKSHLFLLLRDPPQYTRAHTHDFSLSHGFCLNFTGESFDRYCPWRGSLCLATESNGGLRVVVMEERKPQSESDGENEGEEGECRVKSY